MFHVSFSLSNPWSDAKFETLWSRHCMLSKHKAIEVEAYELGDSLVEVSVGVTLRSDHSGARVSIGLFGYCVQCHVYDTRHWDYDNKRYMTYE